MLGEGRGSHGGERGSHGEGLRGWQQVEVWSCRAGGRGCLPFGWMETTELLPVAKVRVVLMAPFRVETVSLTLTCGDPTLSPNFLFLLARDRDDILQLSYQTILEHVGDKIGADKTLLEGYNN